MSFKDREKSILDYLSQNREATIDELCTNLFVSAPTIRRDLKVLAESGKIIRTHGGAFLSNLPWEGTPQELRENEFSEEKDIIALYLLKLLDTKSSIILVTNSSKATFLFSRTGVKSFVSGGEASKTSFAYVGTFAEEFIRKFNADICFFSVSALTPDGRLTDNSISENQVIKAMMECSKKSVLLLNSQKIGAPHLNTLCTLNDVDLVVSEKDISNKFPEHKGKFI